MSERTREQALAIATIVAATIGAAGLGLQSHCSAQEDIRDLRQQLDARERQIEELSKIGEATEASPATSSADPDKPSGGLLTEGDESKPIEDIERTSDDPHLDERSANWTIELDKCQASSAAVVCSLFITNNGADENFTLATDNNGWEGTVLFDQAGREYPSTEVALGDKSARRSRGANKFMVSSIRIPASVTFQTNTDQITRISLLQIGFWSSSTNFDGVRFRDIPLSR